jgi:hypothetical protein
MDCHSEPSGPSFLARVSARITKHSGLVFDALAYATVRPVGSTSDGGTEGERRSEKRGDHASRTSRESR